MKTMKINGFEQAEKCIAEMTDERLQQTWVALGQTFWESHSSSFEGVSMDDWAMLIDSELNIRKVKKETHHANSDANL